MFFFKPVVDNYLTGSTRDYNNRDITLNLGAMPSIPHKYLCFDIKFSKVGRSSYREPRIVISITDDIERPLHILLYLPRENEWFHTQVNRNSVSAWFILSVYRPNFTIGLDNVSTNCSPAKRKYPGPFTSFRTIQTEGMTF